MTPILASQPSVLPSSMALLASRNRHALVAALTFLERAQQGLLGVGALDAWMQRYLVGTGWMPWPGQVSERSVGSVALISGTAPASDLAAQCESIVQEARALVVITLRGFVAAVRDDRFLAAAIFHDRVQRDSRGMMAAWVPRPRGEDPLSEIVLSLFAADILGNRESYDRALGVCRVCGRVAFDATGVERPRCPAHD